MTERPLRDLSLAERVRWAVATFGPRQQDFARRVGTSRERVNAWARGRSSIGDVFAERIAEITRTDASLWTEEPERWLEDQVRAAREQLDELLAVVGRAADRAPAPIDAIELTISRLAEAAAARGLSPEEERLVRVYADELDRSSRVALELAARARGLVARTAGR